MLMERKEEVGVAGRRRLESQEEVGVAGRTPCGGAAKRPRGREQVAEGAIICGYPADFRKKPMGFWLFLEVWTGSLSKH